MARNASAAGPRSGRTRTAAVRTASRLTTSRRSQHTGPAPSAANPSLSATTSGKCVPQPATANAIDAKRQSDAPGEHNSAFPFPAPTVASSFSHVTTTRRPVAASAGQHSGRRMTKPSGLEPGRPTRRGTAPGATWSLSRRTGGQSAARPNAGRCTSARGSAKRTPGTGPGPGPDRLFSSTHPGHPIPGPERARQSSPRRDVLQAGRVLLSLLWACWGCCRRAQAKGRGGIVSSRYQGHQVALCNLISGPRRSDLEMA